MCKSVQYLYKLSQEKKIEVLTLSVSLIVPTRAMAKSLSLNKCKGTIRPLRPDCRVCLKRDGILPIFGDESKPDISMEISIFGEVQVHEDDELPKLICRECFKLLDGAITFRKSAKRADNILRRRIKRRKTVSSHPSSTVIKAEKVKTESAGTGVVQSQKDSEQNGIRIDFVSVQMDKTESDNACSILKHENDVDIDTVHEDHEALENNEKSTILRNDVIKNSSSLHNCKYCSQSFQSSNEYEEHQATVEHKKKYVMSFLPRKNKIKSSEKKTRNRIKHVCEFCNRAFTKQNYTRHMLTEHNIKLDASYSNKKKPCTICNKMLHPRALSNHMKSIHRDGSDTEPKIKLECPICKKLFSKHFFPLHLQRHKQGDTKNYVCDQCGKKFFFKSSFFTHRLIHTNALPHKCEHCPYRGRTKELLKVHVRTHTGDYPYPCTECDVRCSTKSNLNSHMRRHRGPVDFICDACSRGFYSKIQLERHITVSHHGVKNHICSTCGAAFGYRHGLMSHQRKVHKRPKGVGKPKAVYLQLEEKGLLPAETSQDKT